MYIPHLGDFFMLIPARVRAKLLTKIGYAELEGQLFAGFFGKLTQFSSRLTWSMQMRFKLPPGQRF